MKSISEALELVMGAVGPLGPERASIGDADGRWLAADVIARSDLPPFDNSAMDGYAVRAGGAPADLPVCGESRAGGPLPEPLAAGTAMRIFTGAPLPEGADAVVIQENTEAREDAVSILAQPESGQHIRRRGSDLRAGEPMMRRGDRLGPGELGLLAAQRVGAVSVVRRPRVAILSTGDELRELHEPDGPGTIVNSNAYALAAQVREAGGEPLVLPNVGDDLERICTALEEGLAADVLVTCGGVSVGAHDHTKTAFERVGIQADFWKVRMKPGKPLTFGVAKTGTPVLGLPGNPVSAMVTFELFVRPALRKMSGAGAPYRRRHMMPLASDHAHKPGRPELARVSVEADAIRPLRLQGSGSLPSMVHADGLALLSADQEQFSRGDRLSTVLFRDDVGSREAPF